VKGAEDVLVSPANGDGKLFQLHRSGFSDVVIWNPHVEGAASMGDFEPKDGWKNMVLVSSSLLIPDLRRVWKRCSLDKDST
jgi:glucose-6-phosphate 1-epimerase